MKLRSNDWKKQRTKEKISKIAMASDEAFALLILENIWDEWIKVPIEEWENSKKKRQEDEEEDEEEEAVGVEKASQDLREAGEQGARRKGRCRAGKYTKGYIAAGKYMGWTCSRITWFNSIKIDHFLLFCDVGTYAAINSDSFCPCACSSILIHSRECPECISIIRLVRNRTFVEMIASQVRHCDEKGKFSERDYALYIWYMFI